MTTGFNVIPPATAALIIYLPAERLQTKFFFENRGTTFHNHNVSCGNKHKNLLFFFTFSLESVWSIWLNSYIFCIVLYNIKKCL